MRLCRIAFATFVVGWLAVAVDLNHRSKLTMLTWHCRLRDHKHCPMARVDTPFCRCHCHWRRQRRA